MSFIAVGECSGCVEVLREEIDEAVEIDGREVDGGEGREFQRSCDVRWNGSLDVRDVAVGVEERIAGEPALAADVAGDGAGVGGEVDAAGRQGELIAGLRGGKEVVQGAVEAAKNVEGKAPAEDRVEEGDVVDVVFIEFAVGLADDSDRTVDLHACAELVIAKDLRSGSLVAGEVGKRVDLSFGSGAEVLELGLKVEGGGAIGGLLGEEFSGEKDGRGDGSRDEDGKLHAAVARCARF